MILYSYLFCMCVHPTLYFKFSISNSLVTNYVKLLMCIDFVHISFGDPSFNLFPYFSMWFRNYIDLVICVYLRE